MVSGPREGEFEEGRWKTGACGTRPGRGEGWGPEPGSMSLRGAPLVRPGARPFWVGPGDCAPVRPELGGSDLGAPELRAPRPSVPLGPIDVPKGPVDRPEVDPP